MYLSVSKLRRCKKFGARNTLLTDYVQRRKIDQFSAISWSLHQFSIDMAEHWYIEKLKSDSTAIDGT